MTVGRAFDSHSSIVSLREILSNVNIEMTKQLALTKVNDLSSTVPMTKISLRNGTLPLKKTASTSLSSISSPTLARVSFTKLCLRSGAFLAQPSTLTGYVRREEPWSEALADADICAAFYWPIDSSSTETS